MKGTGSLRSRLRKYMLDRKDYVQAVIGCSDEDTLARLNVCLNVACTLIDKCIYSDHVDEHDVHRLIYSADCPPQYEGGIMNPAIIPLDVGDILDRAKKEPIVFSAREYRCIVAVRDAITAWFAADIKYLNFALYSKAV